MSVVDPPIVATRRCDVRDRLIPRSRRPAPYAANLSRPVRRRELPARVTDRPNRISSKAKAFLGIKAVQCLHQADVAFGNDFRNGQAISAVAHGDFGGEPEMTCDKLVCGITVTVLAPTLGERVLLVPLEHF